MPMNLRLRPTWLWAAISLRHIPGVERPHDDGVAETQPFDLGPDLRNGPGHLVADHAWRPDPCVHRTVGDVEVRAADPAVGNVEADLTASGRYLHGGPDRENTLAFVRDGTHSSYDHMNIEPGSATGRVGSAVRRSVRAEQTLRPELPPHRAGHPAFVQVGVSLDLSRRTRAEAHARDRGVCKRKHDRGGGQGRAIRLADLRDPARALDQVGWRWLRSCSARRPEARPARGGRC